MFMYLSSFFLVMGGDSWFLLWMGLEVNMISFIMLVYGKSMMKIEVCLKYFFIQGVGSSMLLMMMILGGNLMKEALVLILSYKMGAGPFFFWFPAFCEGISWYSCILVMSLQKVIPLIFFCLFICSFIWWILLLSMLVGMMGCFNEVKLKKFMAFSSIHYVGWMMLCIMMNSYLWILYLVGYSIMLMGVLLSVSFNETILVGDFLKMKNPFLFFFSMLNMGGMPPMLGFFLKWWTFLIILNYEVMVIWFIVVLSVTMFYLYMRLVFPIMVGYNFYNDFSWYKSLEVSKNNGEWIYMFAVMFSPIIGWVFI